MLLLRYGGGVWICKLLSRLIDISVVAVFVFFDSWINLGSGIGIGSWSPFSFESEELSLIFTDRPESTDLSLLID